MNDELYTSKLVTGFIPWKESEVQILPWDMTKVNMLNMFIDLDGTIRRRKMPSPGIWQFDGQVFYRHKER